MTPHFDFSFFPILETERLRLRRITRDDAPALLELHADPELERFLIIDPPINTLEAAAEHAEWMNRVMFEAQTGIRWGLTRRDDDTLLGTCGVHSWSRPHRRADIGYELNTAYWGRGYTTEAMRAVVAWAFEQLDLHRLQADCTEGNIASERVMEKLGFTLEGTWRENTFEHGRFVNLRQYGLLRREYEAQN